MLNAYNTASNPMMRRPVVNEDVLDFMRTRQKLKQPHLLELQAFAQKNNVPIIPQETVSYFNLILPLLDIKSVLEIGTAIGFSSLLFADLLPQAKIKTIERFDEMLQLAVPNLEKYDTRKQIELIQADAAEYLPELNEKFDFIFMDSAKAQYVKFLPYLLKNLKSGGLLAIDDVFQAGDVFRDMKSLPRRQHNIYKALTRLFDEVLEDEKLESSFLPLGDGLLLIRCK